MKRRNIYWVLGVFIIIVVVFIISTSKPTGDVQATDNIEESEKVGNQDTEHSTEELEADAVIKDLSKIDLQKFTDNETDSINVLDIEIVENEIVIVLSLYNKDDTLSYKLVSLYSNGDCKKLVPLDMPIENGNKVSLEGFTIGLDGNIYAVEVNYEQMSGEVGTPRYNSDTRVLKWNQNGKLDKSMVLEPLDVTKYDFVYIYQIVVTKDGYISMYCKYGSNSLIVNVDKTGKIQNIVESELQEYSPYCWYNYDVSFSFERSVNRRNKNYYLTYDIKLHQFSEEKEIPKEIFDNYIINGNDRNTIQFLKEDRIYQYNVDTEEMRNILLVDNEKYPIDNIQKFIVVNDDIYLIYCVSKSDFSSSLLLAVIEEN